jgi:hypothetical protein
MAANPAVLGDLKSLFPDNKDNAALLMVYLKTLLPAQTV